MGEIAVRKSAMKPELAAVISYLRLGAASIDVQSANGFILSRKGANSFNITADALAYLARKGWVKREGRLVSMTDKAPLQNALLERETEEIQLTENGITRNVTRVTVESPIDYLASRKDRNGVALLSKAEWVAGDRLRSDFTRANMLPGIGMRWGEPIRVSGGPGGGVTQTDAAIAARGRVAKALEAVGPEFSGLLLDVCCFLKGLEQVEAERGWPRRSAKLMLRAGLGILARHYAPPAAPAAKIRNWGADDYRPTL